MRAKTIVTHLVIAVLFTGVGLGLTTILPAQEPNDLGADNFDRFEDRKALAKAQARIKDLEERLADQPWIPEDRPNATKLSDPPGSDEGISGNELAALMNKLAKAKEELAEEKRKNGPMSDETINELIRDASDRFSVALASRDGAAAVQVLSQLSKLDKRAFPTVVKFWAELDAKKWLGMDWRMRRGWATAELFHWALQEQTLEVGDLELAKKFQKEAIWSLSRYEDDPKKQAQTFAAFIEGLPRPDELKPREGRRARRGRGQWGPPSDPFRSTLRNLSQIPSAEASQVLSRLATDQSLPKDVRTTAVRGLIRQVDDASLLALETASRDQDPKIAQRASIGMVKRDPPATGWLITSRNNKGQAESLNIPIGSIITSYDGAPIKRDRDLYSAIRNSRNKGTVNIQVHYNGSVQNYSLKSGKIGIDGETVRSLNSQ